MNLTNGLKESRLLCSDRISSLRALFILVWPPDIKFSVSVSPGLLFAFRSQCFRAFDYHISQQEFRILVNLFSPNCRPRHHTSHIRPPFSINETSHTDIYNLLIALLSPCWMQIIAVHLVARWPITKKTSNHKLQELYAALIRPMTLGQRR